MTEELHGEYYCHDCDQYFFINNVQTDPDYLEHKEHNFAESRRGQPDPGLLRDFKKKGVELKEGEEPKLVNTAETIMQKYKFKTLNDTREILYYNGGVYQPKGDIIISEECERIIPECSRYKVGEVLAIIQRRTFVERSLFNNLTRIVFNNGVLNLSTSEFFPRHDPDLLTTVKMPYDYDPESRCPKFIKLLKDVLTDKEKIITMIELMANVLTRNIKNFEVTLMMIGDGQNGKTTLLKILRAIIGLDNTCSISIHSMQSERFSMSQLEGKLANIYPDISNRELNNLGRFKMAVSNEHITVEKKGKDGYLIQPFAKHFFSANEMPDIKDNSDGIFRRIYVLKFENVFLPGVNRIEDYDRIIFDEEASGIFNLMFANYKTIVHNHGFRYKQSIAQVRETIKRESDKLREFVELCLIPKQGSFIVKDDLFQKYVEFCKYKAYDPYNKQKFSVNMPTYGLKDAFKRVDGKICRIWSDLGWNYEDEWVRLYVRKDNQLTL